MKLSHICSDVRIQYARFIPAGSKSGSEIGTPKGEMLQSDAATFIPDLDVHSVHFDSRDVAYGGAFVALTGLAVDGHDFIPEALARGAIVIITQVDGARKIPWRKEETAAKEGFYHIAVENTREALAIISARFYGDPSNKLCLIGITGTNGKGSTACLIENMLQKAGAQPGVIGTLNYHYKGQTFDNPMTTPEAPNLQRILSEMLEAGVTHVIIEVSSHAIDLRRVDQCWFDVGVFTNLSQDHLDYHGDMETYWSCKKKWLTTSLYKGPKRDKAVVVLNCNDPKGAELSKRLTAGTEARGLSAVTVGEADDHHVFCERAIFDLTGIAGKISISGDPFDFKSALVGKHNLENILCAAGAGVALQLSPTIIHSGIEAVSAVPGRMESIPNPHYRFIYVDYAHSPDALNRVLTALRELTSGRIIGIFGCGGDRDREKRPQMGQIAACRCDLVIITSDNPRTEDPGTIIKQISEGVRKVTTNYYGPDDLTDGFSDRGFTIEPDRKRAIHLGVLSSVPGDTILIAGKGNETYQILGERIIHFDDREEVRQALIQLEMKINS